MENKIIILMSVLLISVLVVFNGYALPLPPGEEEWIRYSQALAEDEQLMNSPVSACKIFQEHCTKKPDDERLLSEWSLKNYELYEQCLHETIEQSIKNLQEQAQKHNDF